MPRLTKAQAIAEQKREERNAKARAQRAARKAVAPAVIVMSAQEPISEAPQLSTISQAILDLHAEIMAYVRLKGAVRQVLKSAARNGSCPSSWLAEKLGPLAG